MGSYAPIGYQQLTVSTAAVGFTLPTVATAGGGSALKPVALTLIRVSGGAVRYRDDGTAPTATVGTPLEIGDTFFYDGDESTIKFIRRDGTDATLDIHYYED